MLLGPSFPLLRTPMNASVETDATYFYDQGPTINPAADRSRTRTGTSMRLRPIRALGREQCLPFLEVNC